MDISAPEGPVASLKDFAMHILIVTIGILIALGLEGVREVVYAHQLVREARENFRAEIRADQSNMKREMENVAQVNAAAKKVIADLPGLAERPEELKARVDALQPSLYFLGSSSWTSALSSGALAHMTTDEVNRYASFDLIVHSYASLEDRLLPQQTALQSYVDSRRTFGPEEQMDTEEKLREFEMQTEVMLHVGKQAQSSFAEALQR